MVVMRRPGIDTIASDGEGFECAALQTHDALVELLAEGHAGQVVRPRSKQGASCDYTGHA